jgi:hypothetical protein
VKPLRWFYWEINGRVREFFCKSYRYDGDHEWESYDGVTAVCRNCGVPGEQLLEREGKA